MGGLKKNISFRDLDLPQSVHTVYLFGQDRKKIAKEITHKDIVIRECLDEIIDEITEILDLVERDELFVIENKKFRVAVLLPFMFDGFDNDYFIKNLILVSEKDTFNLILSWIYIQVFFLVIRIMIL